MRRSTIGFSTMLAITAAIGLGAGQAGFAEAALDLMPPPRPKRREREVSTQPLTARQQLAREIAEHNAAVAARRAEKLARRGTNRKG